MLEISIGDLMLRDKRGQGLSMTMVVVIILALLVLLVVALVFIGGSTNLGEAFNKFVRPQKATSYEIAIKTCDTWCEVGQGLAVEDQKDSSFCRSYQDGVDKNRDGEPDKESGKDGKTYRWYCNNDAKEAAEGDLERLGIPGADLGVGCNVQCKGTTAPTTTI